MWSLWCTTQAGTARAGVESLVSEEVTVQTEQPVAFLTLVHLKPGSGNRAMTHTQISHTNIIQISHTPHPNTTQISHIHTHYTQISHTDMTQISLTHRTQRDAHILSYTCTYHTSTHTCKQKVCLCLSRYVAVYLWVQNLHLTPIAASVIRDKAMH